MFFFIPFEREETVQVCCLGDVSERMNLAVDIAAFEHYQSVRQCIFMVVVYIFAYQSHEVG